MNDYNVSAQKSYLDKISKNTTQKLHFKKRFRQRLGFECSRETYRLIQHQVTSPARRILIFQQSNRVRWYGVLIDGKRCIVVYDNIRKVLVTIFVEHAFTDTQKEIITNLSSRAKNQWEKLS